MKLIYWVWSLYRRFYPIGVPFYYYLTDVTLRAFIPKMYVEIYNSSPLIDKLMERK